MITTYDQAVTQMILYLKERKVCTQSIKSHKDCYVQFRKYLIENDIEWNPDTADSWILSLKGTVNSAAFYSFSTYIWQLDELISTGCVIDRHFYLTVSAYDKLEGFDFQNELNLVASELSDHYTARSMELFINGAALCLLFLVDRGCHSIKDVTFSDIIALHDYKFFPSDARRTTCIGHFRRYLDSMSRQEKCSPGYCLYLDESFSKYVGDIESFSEAHKCFIQESRSKGVDFPASDLYPLILSFIDRLKSKGYSYTVQKDSYQAITVLSLFLDINGLDYTTDISKVWFSEIQEILPLSWRCWRRALALFDQYVTYGDIIPDGKFTYVDGVLDRLPTWCTSVINRFTAERKKAFRSPGTLRSYRFPCARFCSFMITKHLSSFNELTPDLIRLFCSTDEHRTFVGKASGLAIVRQFIAFLEEQHLVDTLNLHLCIDVGTAPSEKIVDVLSDEQSKIIEAFCASAKTPIQMRDAAMVIIGLKMGFRASDVVNLRFSDIDWTNQTITILQYKTKVTLTLPMPTDVGNAIYTYLRFARPKVGNEFIFIRHRAPFGKLTNKICEDALVRILPERKNVYYGGFHVTRRTFATDILRRGGGSKRVMDALGHTDPTSFMKYLSMDAEHMRQCSLSLNELELISLNGGVEHE